jgi:hypothetical protein
MVPAMTRWRRWAAAGVALGAVVLSVSVRWARADPAEVESLIAQGNELRRQGRDAQAVPLFKKAYDLDQTPRTAGQLGLVELAAGYPVDAADHLALALESPQHPWVASNRRSLEKVLARAQAVIGQVTVGGTPMGAAVTVNGRAVGALPLPAAVRVPAGRVVVSVTAPGYVAAERLLQVRAKQTQAVEVALDKTLGASSEPEPAQTGHPEPQATASPLGMTPQPIPPTDSATTISGVPGAGRETSSTTSALRVAAWATAVAAAGGLGAGLGLQHASNTNAEALAAAHCTVVNGVVMPAGDQNCQSINNTRTSEKTWSLVGYIGGATFAVTSAVLFWLSWEPAPSANVQAHAAIRCAPTLGGGISCRGEF